METEVPICKEAVQLAVVVWIHTHLDIQHAINHKTDVVLGDCALIRYGDCHFLQRVNICYPIHLQPDHFQNAADMDALILAVQAYKWDQDVNARTQGLVEFSEAFHNIGRLFRHNPAHIHSAKQLCRMLPGAEVAETGPALFHNC